MEAALRAAGPLIPVTVPSAPELSLRAARPLPQGTWNQLTYFLFAVPRRHGSPQLPLGSPFTVASLIMSPPVSPGSFRKGIPRH